MPKLSESTSELRAFEAAFDKAYEEKHPVSD